MTLDERRTLAARWGCSPEIIKIWERDEPERLRILMAGAAFPFRNDPLDLREESNARGWRGVDVAEATGWTYNTIRCYSLTERRRARLWDIIRGMEALGL